MTALRNKALLLSLTAGIVLGSATSTAPAAAAFKDSASVTASVATTPGAPPTNLVGKLTCTSPDSVMSATWTPSASPQVTGYTIKVTFSDGFVQEKPVPGGATAASWSAPIAKYNVTNWSVQYSVVTQTAYGWTAESAPTGTFRC